jgi:hypothetical protein
MQGAACTHVYTPTQFPPISDPAATLTFKVLLLVRNSQRVGPCAARPALEPAAVLAVPEAAAVVAGAVAENKPGAQRAVVALCLATLPVGAQVFPRRRQITAVQVCLCHRFVPGFLTGRVQHKALWYLPRRRLRQLVASQCTAEVGAVTAADPSAVVVGRPLASQIKPASGAGGVAPIEHFQRPPWLHDCMPHREQCTNTCPSTNKEVGGFGFVCHGCLCITTGGVGPDGLSSTNQLQLLPSGCSRASRNQIKAIRPEISNHLPGLHKRLTRIDRRLAVGVSTALRRVASAWRQAARVDCRSRQLVAPKAAAGPWCCTRCKADIWPACGSPQV